jgi:hypothetical protein
MAPDSSSDDARNETRDPEGPPSSLEPPSRPRPPRPAKRGPGSARAASSSSSPAPFAATPVPAAPPPFDPAPATPPREFLDRAWTSPELLEAEPSNLEIPLTRTRPSSAAPSISIEQAEQDPTERPTTAPRSPKLARNVARKAVPVAPPAPAALPTPVVPPTPRAPIPPPPESSGPSIEIGGDDREETLVGAVPQNLLALSTEAEENTRAYQAPQELIELARRQREGRLQTRSVVATPAQAIPRARELNSARVSEAAPSSPDDAAPPVARSQAPRGEANSYRPSEGRLNPSSGANLFDRPGAATEPPDSDDPDSMPAASEVSNRSEPPLPQAFARPLRSPWFVNARWALLFLAFLMAAGYALGRARGLDLARFLR